MVYVAAVGRENERKERERRERERERERERGRERRVDYHLLVKLFYPH